MIKKEVIYNGNEKQFFATDDPDKVIIRYKDVAVAFNNVKRARFEGKGELSNKISALLLGYLRDCGNRNHFIERVGDNEQLCRRIEILPIEVIVRNRVAGSLAARLGMEACLWLSSVGFAAQFAVLLASPVARLRRQPQAVAD